MKMLSTMATLFSPGTSFTTLFTQSTEKMTGADFKTLT